MKTLILMFWHAIAGDPIARAYDKLQRAAQAHARQQAEVEYENYMADFYSVQAHGINPYQNAQAACNYADARVKQEHHEKYLELEARRAMDTFVTLNACKARLHKLQPKPTDPPAM